MALSARSQTIIGDVGLTISAFASGFVFSKILATTPLWPSAQNAIVIAIVAGLGHWPYVLLERKFGCGQMFSRFIKDAKRWMKFLVLGMVAICAGALSLILDLFSIEFSLPIHMLYYISMFSIIDITLVLYLPNNIWRILPVDSRAVP